jgi:hypothetical protein
MSRASSPFQLSASYHRQLLSTLLVVSNSELATHLCLNYFFLKYFSIVLRTNSALPKVPSVRWYATRRPERPPQKIKDPLLASPNAEVHDLPDGLAFIHRPPPTKESVFSTTMDPASPLLRRRAEKTRADVSDGTVSVPPRMRRSREFPSNRVLGEAEFAEMRRLRQEDPIQYTRGKLAKMFNCSPFLVGQQCPLDTESRRDANKRLESEHAEVRSKWGEGKIMAHAARQRRREFW